MFTRIPLCPKSLDGTAKLPAEETRMTSTAFGMPIYRGMCAAEEEFCRFQVRSCNAPEDVPISGWFPKPAAS